MAMTLLKWIITVPIAIAAVLFALANPALIEFTWSPFHDPKNLPLYFICLSFLGVGFLIGTFVAWIGMGKTRAERRLYKKENKQLEKDINTANEKLTDALSKEQQQSKHSLPPAIDFNDD